jgi:outer membrane receptor protein involved in Fe transport
MIGRKAATLVAAGAFALSAARADAQVSRRFDIPPESLANALRLFARQSGAAIVASPALVEGHSSSGAVGDYTAAQAIDHVLSGTGFHAEIVDDAFVVRRDAAPPHPGEDIVVTGTRIRGAAPIGSPVVTIDRATIERSGRATLADYVQTLPQNFGGGPSEGGYGYNVQHSAGSNTGFGASIDLRGLGTQSTLVLFDGNRPPLGGEEGAFADTSLIPVTAIDRIEILSDGASAIYGTDAVAGVVNIRFRNRLEGFETRLYSGTAGGDYNQEQFSQAAGTRWSGGGMMIAYQYDHHSRLSSADRREGSQDLRYAGGPDLRSAYTVPGTIVAADGSLYGIPDGQDGRALDPSQLLPGVQRRLDDAYRLDLLPSQTTHSVYGSLDQRLAEHVTSYAKLLYANRRFVSHQGLFNRQPVEVDSSNPFYVDASGTGEPETVLYDFGREVGQPRIAGRVDAVTSTAGLIGEIGSWRVEASGSFGRQLERDDNQNLVSYERVADAVADTDPTTALNLFGDGTGNNPATIDRLRAYLTIAQRYQVWSTALRGDGTLFELPAGPVRLAAGYEHRDESFTAHEISTYDTVDPTYTQVGGTPASRRIDAVYAELSVPVFRRDQGFPGKLDLSAAGRADWYSTVGRTINPKVGVRWEAIPGLALRGSYGTSFRAPSFTESVGDKDNLYYPIIIPDPLSPTGQTAVLSINGHIPNLKPERATTWSSGVDISPKRLPGLSVKASYFDIAYRDRVGSGTYDYLNYLNEPAVYGTLTERNPSAAELAAYASSPRYDNFLGIPLSQIGAIIDLRFRNLSQVAVRGIDLDVSYAHDLFGGRLTAGLTGTRLLAIDQRLTATAPVVKVVGTVFNPVRLRLRGALGWSKGGFDANLFANYTDGYSNRLVTPAQRVASWTTIDAQIGYAFPRSSPLHNVRLALSATNLLDRRPPYVQYQLDDKVLGYDPGAASPVGRLLAVQAALAW